MSLIPQNQVTAKDMADWFTSKLNLAKLRASEILLRKKIFAAFFPTPKEGVNKFTLPDGYVLTADHTVERKLDEEMLALMWDELVAAHIDPNEVTRRKRELNVKAYKQLTVEQQRLFDRCLIIDHGSPQMDIKPPTKA